MAAVLAIAGCGDGDDGNAAGTPEAVAEAYIEAQKDGDRARICELYSDAYLEVIEAEGGPCEEGPGEDAENWREEDRRLLDVEEEGDGRAIATISCEDPTPPTAASRSSRRTAAGRSTAASIPTTASRSTSRPNERPPRRLP